MLDYLDTDRCRMRFLRDQLDDPEAADCGRCDNCGGLDAVAPTVSDGGGRARPAPGWPGPGVVVEPRKMWPTALANLGIDLKGKIADGAERGPGGRPAHRPRPRPGAARPVPAGRRPTARCRCRWCRRCVEVLGDWRPRGRRRSSSSSPRPGRTLTADLADGLSRYLQVPVVGRCAIADPARRARARAP